MNVGRAVPIGRCDALPIRVQSPAWWNGQEGSRDDRLAVFGSKQLRSRGAATLERHADGEATDAGATLALAAASLRHPRVSRVQHPCTGSSLVDTSTPARDDLATIRLGHELAKRGRVTARGHRLTSRGLSRL